MWPSFSLFNLFSNKKALDIVSDNSTIGVYQQGKLFYPGAIYPSPNDIERIAKYYRGKSIFDGKVWEVYDRATSLLRDTPYEAQLKQLYIAVNLMDILLTKPADLMVGDPPTYETGFADDTPEQQALIRIVEDNDLNQLIHEIVIGAGIRGDAFLKVYYNYREDFSELDSIPPGVRMEPIIEAVNPAFVFPELSRGSLKKFKAVNIAYIEWEEDPKKGEIPYLNVERHIPGYITYERFRVTPLGADTTYGVPVPLYRIEESVPTGKDQDMIPTGVPRILIHHVPYKTVDDDWKGISGIEKLESVISAINDRLVQIDYILWKHSDPTAYGPEIETDGTSTRFGGRYITITKDDPEPGYMVWDAQLDGAFRELDYLLGIVFQMSETPQWLFGTTLSQDKGGTGTSHTDSSAIKARFMPILSKVKRIRVHVDRAIRDALWTAMELENYANRGVSDFQAYQPVYPKIVWQDGLPKDEKELAEIMQIRTGNKPTIDTMSAIKRLDNVDDMQAKEIMARIAQDEQANAFVDPSIFNTSYGQTMMDQQSGGTNQ